MVTSITKRNIPSCSLHSQFTASQKLPLLFPSAPLVSTNVLYLDDLQANHLNPTRPQITKPRSGNHAFIPPQETSYENQYIKSLIDLVPSKLRAIVAKATLPAKPSLLSSLCIIHPLLILQVDCTALRFVDLLTNLRCR